MKTNPIISLVIPARGNEIMLSKTVIAAQLRANGFPIEIIIVDNGLTQEMHVVGDGLIRIVKYDEKKGTGPARHAGVQAALGKIIVTIDAHVLLDDDWAFNIYFAMSTNAGIGSDAIFCGHVGHINDDFTSQDEPCYHGAKFSWIDEKSPDFRPLAATWYTGLIDVGERGAIMGAFYAFTKTTYCALGAPWRLTSGWGCDEEMISLAAACQEIPILMLPLSCRAWHWFGCACVAYTEQDLIAVHETRLTLASLFPFSEAARKELNAIPLRTVEQIEFAEMYADAYEALDRHMQKWCDGYMDFLKRTDNAVEIDEKYLIPVV